MKYTLIIIVSVLLFCRCNGWLDVMPRQQMEEKDLYKNEEGFKSALTGIYIKLADAGLYGLNTTIYLPEILTHHWTVATGTTIDTYSSLGKFDYTYSGAESLLASIWANYYSAIAQINSLLVGLENTNALFLENKDRIIKGEALALRAFLHLDLLRYWGPVPSKANPTAKVIPYVKEMGLNPTEFVTLSWQEVTGFIEDDLNAAEKLLDEVDPILHNSNANLYGYSTSYPNAPQDSWLFHRQNRMNYYAVLGVKARFYHWIGDKNNAIKYAKLVVEAVNENGSLKFPLADNTSYTTGVERPPRNMVMYCEHLFSVHNSRHQTVIASLFTTSSGNAPRFFQPSSAVATLFDSQVNVNDIRNQSYRSWHHELGANSVYNNHFLKYTGNRSFNLNTSNNIASLNIIPILRVSELYFILIENLPVGSDVNTYFYTYRTQRGLDASVDNTLVDETAVRDRLEKEYRKDFFGEGQMFFFYKKHEYEAYTWPAPFTLPSNAYVLPVPKDQDAFE